MQILRGHRGGDRGAHSQLTAVQLWLSRAAGSHCTGNAAEASTVQEPAAPAPSSVAKALLEAAPPQITTQPPQPNGSAQPQQSEANGVPEPKLSKKKARAAKAKAEAAIKAELETAAPGVWPAAVSTVLQLGRKLILARVCSSQRPCSPSSSNSSSSSSSSGSRAAQHSPARRREEGQEAQELGRGVHACQEGQAGQRVCLVALLLLQQSELLMLTKENAGAGQQMARRQPTHQPALQPPPQVGMLPAASWSDVKQAELGACAAGSRKETLLSKKRVRRFENGFQIEDVALGQPADSPAAQSGQRVTVQVRYLVVLPARQP